MNERIKLLAEQAEFYAWEELAKVPGPVEMAISKQVFDGSFRLKFAELIVRECANHCDLLLDHKISSEWSRGTHDCSRAIKKHFGVEE